MNTNYGNCHLCKQPKESKFYYCNKCNADYQRRLKAKKEKDLKNRNELDINELHLYLKELKSRNFGVNLEDIQKIIYYHNIITLDDDDEVFNIEDCEERYTIMLQNIIDFLRGALKKIRH